MSNIYKVNECKDHEELLNVSSKDLLKLFTKRSNTVEIANMALNNKIVPFNDFDAVTFNTDMWETFKSEKYGNTYQLYIQSLRICVHLLLVYESSREDKYFDKASEIINSWLKYSLVETNNKMVWYDHPTASRVHVITHFVYLAKKHKKKFNEKQVIKSLKIHAEILLSDDNYKMNNHGVMVDRSLLLLGNVLEDPYIFNKAYGRIKKNYWHNFSLKGVHLENSPDYHVMVLKMFKDISKYLKKHDMGLGKDIDEHMNKSESYQNYVLKPSMSFPTIGDTEYRKRNIKKIYNNIYDPEAGLCIVQSNIRKPIYLSFVCGYSSKVHKHKDDLSITLNYNEDDFIFDPGKYNYGKNKIRQYLTSKEAHSAFYLQEKDYDIKNENANIKFNQYYETKDYVHVVGKHSDYNDTSIVLTRHIIQFKEELLIIIIDQASNYDENHMFVQNYNIPKNINIVQKDELVFLISKKDKIIMRQENFNTDTLVKNSNESKPEAIASYNFNEISECKQIQFKNYTNGHNVFITTIFDSQNTNPIINITNDTLHINHKKNYKVLI